MAPSERIVLRGFVLRRWSPDDVAALVTAVRESLEHLRPWFPWAAEPPSFSSERKFLDAAARGWRAGEAFEYAILDSAEQTLLGGAGARSHPGSGVWDIGYWVHVDHVRRGIATASAAALTRVAMSFAATERVEIHCDQANEASARVAARLGFRLDRVQDDETLMLLSGKRTGRCPATRSPAARPSVPADRLEGGFPWGDHLWRRVPHQATWPAGSRRGGRRAGPSRSRHH